MYGPRRRNFVCRLLSSPARSAAESEDISCKSGGSWFSSAGPAFCHLLQPVDPLRSLNDWISQCSNSVNRDLYKITGVQGEVATRDDACSGQHERAVRERVVAS